MKMKLIFLALLGLIVLHPSMAQQALDGVRICLDPGHGGHDSDDRPTELGVGTTYYESDANWEVVGYLDSLLQKLGAETKITKVTNDPESEDRDPSLSDRVQVGNAFESDYFHSFHTNGSDNTTVNYTLILYAGPEDGTADYPESYEMAEIMDDELFAYMRTTTKYARADIPFTGYTNGLGVLNNLNMPSTLSEASFHSNIDEGRRLMNSSYRKAAAWGVVKSFLKYFEQPSLSVGEIGGVVTDEDGTALNEVTVTLQSGTASEKVYSGDVFLNGFYFFDWLSPGSYEVKIEKFGFDAKIETVEVVAGQYAEVDVSLTKAGGAPGVPELLTLETEGSSGVSAQWVANTEETLLGYRLYYATDGTKENWMLAADESVLDAGTTSIVLASSDEFQFPPQEEVNYFELRSVAESGAESEGGQIFSIWSNPTEDQVLIVDGFDRRTGSYTEAEHDFISSYMTAIKDTRVAGVSSCTNESVAEGLLSLSDYDLVVWILGDESTTNETFDTDEQEAVSAYLDAGGKLLVSGSEIGWDLDVKGDEADQTFYASYLKASCIGDGSASFSPASGISGTVFDGQTVDFGITYPEDYPDDIAAVDGAEVLLSYAVEGAHGGVGYKGTFANSGIEGGLVYFSFPIETASETNQRLLIKTAMDYLEVGGFYTSGPASPVLLSAIETEEGRVLSWSAEDAILLAGFRVYYALDDDLDNWHLLVDEEDLSSSARQLILSDELFVDDEAASVSVFKLVAVADGGTESASSDAYAVSSTEAVKKVLIVDGFDRVSGSYKVASHDFAARYYEGIRAASDAIVHTTANEQIENEIVDLSDYDRVFWILGDESTTLETFSSVEQEKLKVYLDQGGQLFVSGSEVGWDLSAKGSDSDLIFYTEYLKAEYKSDGGPDFTVANGVAGGIFESLSIPFGVVYPEDYPDEIAAVEGAENVFAFAGSEHFSGVSYHGAFAGTDEGTVIYLSFPLETAVQADLETVIAEVLGQMDLVVLSAPESMTQDFVLYPNPSFGDVHLRIQHIGQSSFTVTAYDFQGRKHQEWSLEIQDDLLRIPSSELTSGMYWFSVQNESFNQVIRFVKK